MYLVCHNTHLRWRFAKELNCVLKVFWWWFWVGIKKKPLSALLIMHTKKRHSLVFSLTAKRLETHKDMNLEDADWAKCQQVIFPAIEIEKQATLKQKSAKPLRRCQSARAHVPGHARKRSLGRCDSSQSQVAFSSTIVSNTRFSQ